MSAHGAERHDADVLVVGAGLAGLTTALSAGARRVTILCPQLPPGAMASALAQGGIAAAVGADDDPALHEADTLRAGAGECHRAAVHLLCTEALDAIRWLEAHGARFDRHDGGWALHREAAHGRARVLHAGGDATGAALAAALHGAVRSAPHVEFRTGCTAFALVRDAGRVRGILAFDAEGRPLEIQAHDTVLATGGIGQLYCHTTNPPASCGDGLAIAVAAGARCAGLEFVQFHPTALSSSADPLPLLTEALRGAGARLVDESGRPFMADAHPDAELAPRDVVARAVWQQLLAGRRVYLDAVRVLAGDPATFPTVRALCARHGIDPTREGIPVVPAAHFHMGGIAVDTEGRSSLPHLWACGEVACSGVHGANRLASNSLLEAVVFGRRLGAALAAAPHPVALHAVGAAPACDVSGATPEIDARVWDSLRRLMWNRLGITRHAAGLQAGLAELGRLGREAAPGQVLLHGRLRLAAAMIAAALARRESCGAHLRTDAEVRAASA